MPYHRLFLIGIASLFFCVEAPAQKQPLWSGAAFTVAAEDAIRDAHESPVDADAEVEVLWDRD